LIEYAYDLRPFQLKGGPAWIGNELFTVAAKGTASGQELNSPY